MMVLLAVFIGGLMAAGRPHTSNSGYARHMKLVGLYILGLPIAVSGGTGVAMAMPGERASMFNAGPHGCRRCSTRSPVRPPTTAAHSRDQRQYDLVQLCARDSDGHWPILLIIAVLGVAGTFAAQRPGAVTAGTLRTTSATFVSLIMRRASIVGLGYLPALALGPVADALL